MATSTMMVFGDFVTVVRQRGAVVKSKCLGIRCPGSDYMATLPNPTAGQMVRSLNIASKAMLDDYSKTTAAAFATLRNVEAKAKARHEESRICSVRKGVFGYKPYTKNFLRKRSLQQKQREDEEKWFQSQPDSIVGRIISYEQPQLIEEDTPRVVWPRALKKPRIASTPKKLLWNECGDELMKAVQPTSYRTLEVIGNKRRQTHRISLKRVNWKSVFKVETRHETGLKVGLDPPTSAFQNHILNRLLRITPRLSIREIENLTKGSSGYLIDDPDDYAARVPFVVRGRYNSILLPSTQILPRIVMNGMVEYSQGEEFWAGFNEAFVAKRKNPTHAGECRARDTVRQCGEAAGILWQGMFPCFKITCGACQDQVGVTADDIVKGELIDNLFEAATNLDRLRIQPNISGTLNAVATRLQPTQDHVQVCQQIIQAIGDDNDGPARHLRLATEKFITLQVSDAEKCIDISKNLLLVANFIKNRRDGLVRGDVKEFKNKISNKAHVNPVLMCDNQLDANGNFVWGERSHHAKRFFDNFYMQVNVADDYGAHVLRRHPKGSRRLAIDRLTLQLDLKALQEHVIGYPIERAPITSACISKKYGAFVFTCSCITLDDKTPLYSDIIMPTKQHLVIGNSGDSKLIDFPETYRDKLWIARDGYCYVNIFLAMLVNINEVDAKNFAKTIRDRVIPQLKEWPTMRDLAASLHMLTVLFPDTRQAELPRILVDHRNKMMHVVDSYGSSDIGFHILKAGTVSQLLPFMFDSTEGEMKNYQVGGTLENLSVMKAVQVLIKSPWRPKLMNLVLTQEPFLIALAVVSPSVLVAMHTSGTFELAIERWLEDNQDIAVLFSTLNSLAEKVSRSRFLVDQMHMIEESCEELRRLAWDIKFTSHSKPLLMSQLEVMCNRRIADGELTGLGFKVYNQDTYDRIEKKYINDIRDSWFALSLCAKFRYRWYAWRLHRYFTNKSLLSDMGDFSVSAYASVQDSGVRFREGITRRLANTYDASTRACIDGTRFIMRRAVGAVAYCIPDILHMINTLIVVSLILAIAHQSVIFIADYKRLKQEQAFVQFQKETDEVAAVHALLTNKLGTPPSEEEFIDHITDTYPALKSTAMLMTYPMVKHQAKTHAEAKLEQIMARMALAAMMFDAQRSDAVFKVLSKIKTVLTSAGQSVHHQMSTIDDSSDVTAEKLLTIDFETEHEAPPTKATFDVTFSDWFDRQLREGRTIPHYRQGGTFLEFTRATSVQAANTISHDPDIREFMIRGPVGSGKSSSLPYELSKKGHVLIIEPTRPLVENVCAQLRQDPFFQDPTKRMRDNCTFGSSNITVMTPGYALNLLGHNVDKLQNYKFIIFDECHVIDASTIAFYCLLHEYTYPGKIVKVSATPPGRESEFHTQHKVDIIKQESLTFDEFATAQGRGTKVDMTKHGDNILVYVASYNDVDALGKLLIERGYTVSKIDGRTMKSGNVKVETRGTSIRKHFIVATNIIENGVTLNVDAVVDFGLKVTAELDSDMRTIIYKKTSISFGERIQRMGRVGRVKPGSGLRIGYTEKGVADIPTMVATEAAFLCFAFGLPVVTQNASVDLLGKCTVRQARSMQLFELPPFFMVDLVRYDGVVHPEIHTILKQFKLKESELVLNTNAMPFAVVKKWYTAEEYQRLGNRNTLEPQVKIPFFVRNIPEKVYEDIWKVVSNEKDSCCFPKISSASACKVAYTLKRDPLTIARTLGMIEHLITQERIKHEHYNTLSTNASSSHGFTLSGITDQLRQKYMRDHSTDNIRILEEAKNKLCEFENLDIDLSNPEMLRNFGVLNIVQHQTSSKLSTALGLKGRWDGSLITRDIIVLGCVLIGGLLMVCEFFKWKKNEPVHHQGRSKQQSLKFRRAREQKHGYEVYGNDGAVEREFGPAYTKKEKKKGKTHRLGKKTRPFVNMYNFDPTEYTIVRYVDNLTGETLDESIQTDITIVMEHFADIREQMVDNRHLDPADDRENLNATAYFMHPHKESALKVDLTPHNPLLVGRRRVSIAGYPERRGELRQTEDHTFIPVTEVPAPNSYVDHETKSIVTGLRCYDPIAKNICKIVFTSDGTISDGYGIGYGSILIVNQHLFKRNNGSIKLHSCRGTYTIPNSTVLKISPVKDRDIALVRLPQDFVPFPQKLQFSKPDTSMRICLVGAQFQTNHVTTEVSDASQTFPQPNSGFWKHWISTQEGHCGLPLVDVNSRVIVGIHSLGHDVVAVNYMTSIPENFKEDYLEKLDELEWTKKWRYNTEAISWGGLKLSSEQPSGFFKPTKAVEPLPQFVSMQSREKRKWVADALCDNLQIVASCPSQLVTKHVVKDRCQNFLLYLSLHPEANTYFQPLLGKYGKSRLNKEAFVKDFTKYASPIVVGVVDCAIFEAAVEDVKFFLHNEGFQDLEYVNDEMAIFQSLNMKAAVGALYSGKKREYFEDYTPDDKAEIIKQSCERLYNGQLGLWNASLKAEIRPMEKVSLNKTRTFTAAPLETLLAGKVCVDDFNNWFYTKHTECPWTVGISKFYGGWNEMLTRLPDNWIYCDADGTRFDSSLSPYLINAVLEIRLSCMENWDIGEKMLENLYTEIVYTPILTPDGSVVKKFKGNNSGQPSTVVDNSLMVLIAMTYTLRKLGVTKEKQDSVIKFFINGDDLIIAVEPESESILDDFSKHFMDLGLDFDFSNRVTKKQELWFMSHQGIERNGILIPKLEAERVVAILEWDRSVEPVHRLEAICAAMIEAWGNDELLLNIRLFYQWLLGMEPFKHLASIGKAPYIAETALEHLYTGKKVATEELEKYFHAHADYMDELIQLDSPYVSHQAGQTMNAGATPPAPPAPPTPRPQSQQPPNPAAQPVDNEPPAPQGQRDRDLTTGSSGTFTMPPPKIFHSKMRLPMVKGKIVVNADHLKQYKPNRVDLSNARRSQAQFEAWFAKVQEAYDVTDDQMSLLMDGLLVWCIENGTSPNLTGNWYFMNNDVQDEYPLKPVIENARPTFRQVMMHFSNLAEAYIEMRNATETYIPRYALKRNLRDTECARYAFDFYEKTSLSPEKAIEVQLQMKAAAIRGKSTRMFGLDGNINSGEENTERHTTDDVTRDMHSLMGVRNM
ncbi:polyprotein [Cocksfoot streak virus]|uniref:Genome polyprotein n=11 Tax=Cocksfoot streak virus TaxID=192452 RepID=Q8QQA0_9POTV|nr:polyprotein [Cocksfoot streak virus]AAM19343.1 polyprotein [Cocksfoot streak virus]